MWYASCDSIYTTAEQKGKFLYLCLIYTSVKNSGILSNYTRNYKHECLQNVPYIIGHNVAGKRSGSVESGF
jgi:hypothetical protein